LVKRNHFQKFGEFLLSLAIFEVSLATVFISIWQPWMVHCRDEHGQDWIRTEANFGRIRAGSDCNFFENWRIRTRSDWENLLFWCDYSNHIKNVTWNV